VVLTAAAGKLLGDWLEFRDGLVFGIIAGVLIAPLVPQKGGPCSLPNRSPGQDGTS
jgi:hypothetical protein